MWDNAVMISSTIPSAKYSCSGSPDMFNVHPDAPGVSVPGRDHRLGDATGVVLAAVQHAHGGVLRRSARRRARPVRQTPYLQNPPGAQFTSDEFTQLLRDHGVEISMDRRGRC